MRGARVQIAPAPAARARPDRAGWLRVWGAAALAFAVETVVQALDLPGLAGRWVARSAALPTLVAVIVLVLAASILRAWWRRRATAERPPTADAGALLVALLVLVGLTLACRWLGYRTVVSVVASTPGDGPLGATAAKDGVGWQGDRRGAAVLLRIGGPIAAEREAKRRPADVESGPFVDAGQPLSVSQEQIDRLSLPQRLAVEEEGSPPVRGLEL